MSISDRLDLYFGKANGDKSPAPMPAGPDADGIQVIRKTFLKHPFAQGHSFAGETMLPFGKARVYPREALLFLDVECIELGFGVNNIPYLIGLGRLTQSNLEVIQVFSPSPLEEEEALSFLDNHWRQFDYVVTYNGKSFDIPLIKSRFAHFCKENPQRFVEHFDLYRILRKIYPLERYRLIDGERLILGWQRENDLSGAYSGQAYFEFQKYGDRTLLDRILEHNLWDIVSLASLALSLADEFSIFHRFLNGSSQLPRARKIYKYDPAYLGEERLATYLVASRPDADDLFHLGKTHKAAKRYHHAYAAFRRSHRAGKRDALLQALVLAYHYLGRVDLALRLANKYLPVEEANLQSKLLQLIKKLQNKEKKT